MTDITPLSFRSSLEEYQKQAEELFEALRAGDPGAIQLVRHKHPRFLDASIPWLPKNLSDSQVRSATLELADAQLGGRLWAVSQRASIAPNSRSNEPLYAVVR